MKAKKSLGQHFLRDQKILRKIADFADIKKDVVVEIGPGEGTLTSFLLERAEKVTGIEKDQRMIEFLKDKFAHEIKTGKFEIIEEDILETDNSSFVSDYILVGNIPYYITGALFKKFLETENQPGSITLVVQKEVVDRILARDGKESILSISVKVYGSPSSGGIIKSGSFYPQPKVDSAIIHIANISKTRLEGINESKFFEILKTGFSHKRKLLIKNLLEILAPRIDVSKLKEIFGKCNIAEKVRAENLKVSDWICLTKEIA